MTSTVIQIMMKTYFSPSGPTHLQSTSTHLFSLVCMFNLDSTAPPAVGETKQLQIENPLQLSFTVKELDYSTHYDIRLYGVTNAGHGVPTFVQGKTLPFTGSHLQLLFVPFDNGVSLLKLVPLLCSVLSFHLIIFH